MLRNYLLYIISSTAPQISKKTHNIPTSITSHGLLIFPWITFRWWKIVKSLCISLIWATTILQKSKSPNKAKKDRILEFIGKNTNSTGSAAATTAAPSPVGTTRLEKGLKSITDRRKSTFMHPDSQNEPSQEVSPRAKYLLHCYTATFVLSRYS